MDLASLAALIAAAAASAAALALARRGRPGAALACLLLTGAVLRADLAAHRGLSKWDERYHAVVARNLVDHPLRPTLVDVPFDPQPPEKWTRAHVWLHKPPLALWLAAGSLALFGENEVALRVPSVVLGTLGVLLTFLLGRRFLGPAAGLTAAGFHAWHGRSALLSGGLRAVDHVDVTMIFLVELGVWLAVLAADALAAGHRRARALTGATGLVFGLALLTKDAPALVVPAVFGLLLLARPVPWRVRLGAPAGALAAGLVVALPWQIHTARAFPEAFTAAGELSARRLVEAIEGHAGPWTFHVGNLGRHFGALVYLPLAAFLVEGARARREWLPLAGWLVLTYAVFSLAATKMESYVLIACPVIFLALGWFGAGWRGSETRGRRALHGFLAVAVAVLFLHDSVRAHRPWRPRLRDPLWAKELRHVGREVGRLGEGPWLVFHVPAPTEAMFYARATFERHVPDAGDVGEAVARGFRVAVYGTPAQDPRMRALAGDPRVAFLPYDPRALGARRIADAIAALEGELLVVGARAPVDLEAYLEHHRRVSVRGGPRPDAAVLGRLVRTGRTVIVLEPEGAATADEALHPGVVHLDAPEWAHGAPAVRAGSS